jgi:hypothetical protein
VRRTDIGIAVAQQHLGAERRQRRGPQRRGVGRARVHHPHAGAAAEQDLGGRRTADADAADDDVEAGPVDLVRRLADPVGRAVR